MIRPFQALRYNPKRVPDLRRVVSAMSEAEMAQAGGLHPYSAAYLMRPENASEAQQRVQSWLAGEILLHDPLPALYPYLQTFTPYGGGDPVRRVGFLALVHVGNTTIYPHEGVLEASLPGRVAALKASGLQSIPTHGLYEDPERQLERMIEANLGYPLAEVVDAEGVRHTLGRFTDLMLIQRCEDVLRDRPIYLADGHHRLETFLRFRSQWIAANGEPPVDHPVNFHLMYLSNFCGPDLRIRPFHRVLGLPIGVLPSDVVNGVQKWFHVVPTHDRTPPYEEMRANPGAIGLVLDGKLLLLRAKFAPAEMASLVPLAQPAAVRQLAYTWVHYLILDQLLGIPYAEQAHSTQIRYLKSMGAAIKEAQTQPRTLCLLMPEVSPQEMMDVCQSGARMPQKSTYFYPKVNGGLLFSLLDTN